MTWLSLCAEDSTSGFLKNPDRSEYHLRELNSKGFNLGIHSSEVKVENIAGWTLGVTTGYVRKIRFYSAGVLKGQWTGTTETSHSRT